MRNVILCGDVRDQLRLIPDETVNCVVTSPPYWGLRDYGTASWEGGDPEHAHRVHDERASAPGSAKQASSAGANYVYAGDCSCGAVRVDSQLGLEKTPEEYVCNMVEVFREVRRVLRKDGTLWLNLGDSYAGSGKGPSNSLTQAVWDSQPSRNGAQARAGAPTEWLSIPGGLKAKDLVGIPWRVAFALQADGWWLRSDIIWSKPNPMPESVTDRPTKAHEYVFLLSKSERYYYDADAIKENANPDHASRYKYAFSGAPEGRVDPGGHERIVPEGEREYTGQRNRRTVWEIATRPYPEAHFATYPEELVKPCILAGCPEGGIVLDPFLGSGTTASVAKTAGRDWIGIELNPTYVELAKARINVDQERLL